MSDGEGGVGGTPGRPGRRLQTALFLLALLAIAVTTAAGYILAVGQERDEVDQRAVDTAAVAAASTATIIGRGADALGGASAIADEDDNLDLDAFRAFAGDLAGSGVTSSIALLAVVDGADRDRFEAELGSPILATGADGQLAPAPAADRYLPVIELAPRGPAFAAVGFDYRSDPDRGPAAEAAAAAGRAAVTAPTTLPGTGERGVIFLHAIYPRGDADGGEPVGFVASSLTVDDLASALQASLPPGTPFHITDAGQTVAASGQPGGRHARSMAVEVPGRRWELVVEPAEGPDSTVATVELITGVAVELGVLVLFVVTLRHQRRLGRANRSMARAEHRSRTLERLASRLSRSLSGVEVAEALLESLPGLTGAGGGAVTLLSADGEQLDLVAASGYAEDQLGRLVRVGLDDGSVLQRAASTGEAAWLPSPLTWRDDPALPRFAEIGRAAAVVPLVADDVLGILVVSQPGVRRFSDDERSLLVTIGALAGQALARSLRYDAEHASSLAFQRASLPPTLPETPGVDVAARYRPAAISAAVGGDWYDVLRLDDGRLAVVVGDVVGHGVPAAAAMGQLRTAVRVLASVVPDPVMLLRSLSAHVGPIPDALAATMAYGVVDPVSGRFDYVRAGHLPPLVLRAAGGAELLAGEPWPPLGVSPQSPPGTQTAMLHPGDTLVLYTDGVAERRGESLTVGLERLRAAGAALGDLDPGDLCDALLEAIVPSEDQADDVAMLAIRLAPVAATSAADGGEPRPATMVAEA